MTKVSRTIVEVLHAGRADLFVISWSKSEVIEPIPSHTAHSIKELEVGDIFHTQSFVLSSSSLQQPAVSSQEEIVIPRKKTWNKVAVLQALAGTVKRDVTAYDYRFQDDPILSPSGSLDVKILTLAEESGRNVAKYFISTYPKYFQTDYAEPHIPCFMPEVTEPQIEGVSEAALKERIQLRRVTDAVDLYDQLLQGGNTVSLNVTNDLLDLICLYGDRDPVKESFLQQTLSHISQYLTSLPHSENNNAERIFGLLSEPNTRSYSALIQGMVKHGAFSKAIETYTDLRRNGLIGDVAIFNALIRAVWGSYPTFNERVEKSMNFLVEMESQKIKPNLNTFNAVLKCLLNSGKFGRASAFSVFSEMKALNIEPSLGSYNFLIYMFYNAALKDHEEANIAILDNVMNEILGKSFTPQHPEDGTLSASY
ncbi:hypothetical protein DNTS_006100 [Danionella cerebrum]|uniref:Small ribosomal subunit protein mS39 n=1 Tax=Danionella cerebrum TaxID=2873325 RepID=A0A553QME9_9TELE|nr:hypothetical protein DNTS_006100 [Danionella translucida]